MFIQFIILQSKTQFPITESLSELFKQANKNETLFLQYIDFLANEAFTPLIAYIQLKKYQFAMKIKSVTFNAIVDLRISVLRTLCIKFQAHKMQNTKDITVQEHYHLHELRETDKLVFKVIPLMAEIIQNKGAFFVHLIKGISHIEKVSNLIFEHSKSIESLEHILHRQLQIDPFRLAFCIEKLNSVQLRLLCIYKAVIMQNYIDTHLIEKKIEDLLIFQKTLSKEIVLDSQLLKNKVALITISILEDRGKIINNNKNMLALFFQHPEVNNINQIMPTHFQKHHNDFIDEYIQRGYSKFFSAGQFIFFQNSAGFLTPCKLKLENIFNGSSDYMIVGSILKIEAENHQILFDIRGKIIGISQNIFESLFRSITPFDLCRHGMIQAFMWNIVDLIIEYQGELINNETIQTIQTIYEKKACLSIPSHTNQYMQQFLQFLTYKTQESEQQFDGEAPKISDKIKLINEKQNRRSQEFIQLKLREKIHNFEFYNIRFSLSYKQLEHKKQDVSYFIVQINEVKKIDEFKSTFPTSFFHLSENNPTSQEIERDSQLQYHTKPQVTITNTNNPTIISKDDPDIGSENLDLRLQSSFQKCFTNQDLPISPQINQKRTKQFFKAKPLFQHPATIIKAEDQNFPDEEFSSKQIISQLVSPRNEQLQMCSKDEFIELDQIEQQDFFGRSSSLEKNKVVNVKDILENNRNMLDVFEGNKNKSSSSMASDKTSLAIFSIVKSLQHSKVLTNSLKQLYMINSLLILSILIICICQIVIINDDIKKQQKSLSYLSLPATFNEQVAAFTTLSQTCMANFFKFFEESPYIQAKKKDELTKMVGDLPALIHQLVSDFTKFEKDGYKQEIHVVLLTNNGAFQDDVGFIKFLELLYDNAFALITYFDNLQFNSRQILSYFFFKLNVVNISKLSHNLIIIINDEIKTEIFLHLQVQQILLISYISITAFIIGMQISLWKRNLLYQQRIILLVSKIYQNEAEEQIIKYQTIKDIILTVDQKWKQINFFQLVFMNQIDKKSKKKKMSKIPSENENQSLKLKETKNSLLNFRIQEVRFSFYKIYLFLFILLAFLSIFYIGGFLFYSSDIESTSPQLNLAVEFMNFRQGFEALIAIAELVKTDHLIDDAIFLNYTFPQNDQFNSKSSIFTEYQSNMLEELNKLYQNNLNKFETLYDLISLSTKFNTEDQNQLIKLYNSDMCNILKDQLNYCIEKNQYFEQNQPFLFDNYTDYIKYGMHEITSRFQNFLNTNFPNELQGKFLTDEEAIKYLQNVDRVKLIMTYYLEIYKAFKLFKETILFGTQKSMDEDIQSLEMYYILGGIFVIILCSIILHLSIQKSKQQTRFMRLALSFIPLNQLFEAQTLSKIKSLDRF